MVMCSSFFALITTGLEVYESYRDGVENIEEKHRNITMVQRDVLSRQALSGDASAAAASVGGLVRLDDIDRVEVEWRSLQRFSAGADLQSPDLTTVFPLEQSRDGLVVKLGELRIYTSYDALRLEVFSLLGLRLLYNLLKTIAVSAALLYFYHQIVVVHLQKMARHAEAMVQNKRFSRFELQRASGHENDELQALANAINDAGDWQRQEFLRREQQRDELQKQVEQRTAHLHEANRQLVDKSRLATIGSLVGMVAHELRNPLGSIKATVRLLAVRDFGAENAGAIARIERNIDRCDTTVEQLRRMSNKSVQHWRVIEFGPWLSDYLGSSEELEDDIDLHCELAPGLWVFVDQFQLELVVRNLLENARHALNDAPGEIRKTIRVRLRKVDDNAVLTITDNGRGLDPEVLSRAFEALYSTKQYGFGMGLTLSRNLVEFMGGTLELCSSGCGQGAVATLVLGLVGEGQAHEQARVVQRAAGERGDVSLIDV